jgi:formylglycine-generating enzyme required for sulfatase activity
MVAVPAGRCRVGSDEHYPEERPARDVEVAAFRIDATPVTNGAFAAFVAATGYVTIAERKPTQEEFPDAPPENLVAGSVVFTPPDHEVPLNNHFQWWDYIKGANWRHPTGPESNIEGKGNYPVVQVGYPDRL